MLSFDFTNPTSGLGSYQSFISRPDLHPPILNVNGSGTPGLVLFDFLNAADFSLIMADNNGDLQTDEREGGTVRHASSS